MATTHTTDNQYELRKKRNAILGEEFYKDKDAETDTASAITSKEKLTKTAKGLTSDLLLGVIGGGLAGALLGKYSFLVGLGVAGYGHYSDNKLLGTVGLGMMASGTAYALLGGKEQDPKATTMEKVTERLNGFKNELKRKVWIDKWGSKDGLNGLSGDAAENKSSANTQKENQKNNSADFTKPVEPINPNQFSKLTKQEEAKLDEQMQNATILAFNQFYALRHNLNGVNDKDKASAINDLENEIKKATGNASAKTTTKQNNSEVTKENSKPADKDFDKDDNADWEGYASGAKTKQNYSGTNHSYKSKSKTDDLEDLDVGERLF